MLKQILMLECQSLICSAADEKFGNVKMKRAMWEGREQLATNESNGFVMVFIAMHMFVYICYACLSDNVSPRLKVKIMLYILRNNFIGICMSFLHELHM